MVGSYPLGWRRHIGENMVNSELVFFAFHFYEASCIVHNVTPEPMPPFQQLLSLWSPFLSQPLEPEFTECDKAWYRPVSGWNI